MLDPFAGTLARISDGRSFAIWRQGNFPINSAIGAAVVRDKAHCYDLLRSIGQRVPEGRHFFIVPEWSDRRPSGRELPDAFEYAAKLGYPVFVKPLKGTGGRNAVKVPNPAALGHHLVTISREAEYGALIQRVETGAEHRLFILENRLVFSYRKRPIAVVGDGETDVATLVGRIAGHVFIDRNVVHAMLEERFGGKSGGLTYVPPAGERLQLSDNANPHVGSVIDDFRTSFAPALHDWAARIAGTVKLRICGIDLFAPQSVDDDPGEFCILEVNSSPALKTIWEMGERDVVRAIWAQAIAAALKDGS